MGISEEQDGEKIRVSIWFCLTYSHIRALTLIKKKVKKKERVNLWLAHSNPFLNKA